MTARIPQSIQHIESRPNREGQSTVFISGTRIRVQDIYVLAELRGDSPDAIVGALPQLSLGQVHAALSYFYDHRDEVLREYERDKRFAEEMEDRFSPTEFSRFRDQVLSGKDGVDNPLPS